MSNSTHYNSNMASNSAQIYFSIKNSAIQAADAIDVAVEALKKKKDKIYPSTPRLDRRAKRV